MPFNKPPIFIQALVDEATVLPLLRLLRAQRRSSMVRASPPSSANTEPTQREVA